MREKDRGWGHIFSAFLSSSDEEIFFPFFFLFGKCLPSIAPHTASNIGYWKFHLKNCSPSVVRPEGVLWIYSNFARKDEGVREANGKKKKKQATTGMVRFTTNLLNNINAWLKENETLFSFANLRFFPSSRGFPFWSAFSWAIQGV